MTVLTEEQKTMIADAVEKMRPLIEGPARLEVDYPLSAQDITLVANALLLWGEHAECRSVCRELREKFLRGFETVIRDVQP